LPTSPTTDLAHPAQRAAWWREVGIRVRWRPLLKTAGITAFLWLFFVAYFHLLRHPARPVIEMPLTALDRAIGVQPAMLGAYVSLWLYVGIAPGLLLRLRELLAYGLWAAAMCLAGLLCFYFVPTAVPRLELAIDVAQHPGFALLQGVDAAGNACPSLHVAGAMFSAIWIDRLLRDMGAPALARALNAAWLALIVYSTLAVKQHVVYDVVGGAALALLFAGPSMRWFPRSATWPAGRMAAGVAGGGR
jgi:membrane-associated phospholipid phosphatase